MIHNFRNFFTSRRACRPRRMLVHGLLAIGMLLNVAVAEAAASGNSFSLNLPNDPVPDRVSYQAKLPARERTTVANLDGAGCIRHIRIMAGGRRASDGRRNKMMNRKIIFRIYFDGSETPNVEGPVGDLFGVMHAQDYYPINTPLISVQAENSYNCYFEMPFAKGARIEIETGPEEAPITLMVDWLPVSGTGDAGGAALQCAMAARDADATLR